MHFIWIELYLNIYLFDFKGLIKAKCIIVGNKQVPAYMF